MQLTIRQRWNDDRLAFIKPSEHVQYLHLGNTKRIWVPDIFVSNDIEAEQHDILVPNELVRIYQDGSVLYSTRATFKLSCPMEFQTFPFDGQACYIIMPSYGYTVADLKLTWHDTPLQIMKNIHPEKFTLEKFYSGYCDSKTATGEYSCLKVGFLFKRLYGFYQIQVYIPTAMLVILSWFTFWLHHEHVTARITLALVTLLTMAVQVASFNSTVPVVSYTKALDVWTGVCLTFSFGALIEFIIVHQLSRRKKPVKTSTEEIPLNAVSENEKSVNDEPKVNRTRFCCNVWPILLTPEGFDLVSRMIYPLLFILFNIVYWTAYAFAFSYKESEFDDGFVDVQQRHQIPHHLHV